MKCCFLQLMRFVVLNDFFFFKFLFPLEAFRTIIVMVNPFDTTKCKFNIQLELE